MNDSTQRQLRAYVNILQAVVLNIDDPQHRIFRIDIKNFGQTPAYKLSTAYNCIVREYPLDNSNPLPQVRNESREVFIPLAPTCQSRLDYYVPYNGEWAEPMIKDGRAAIYCFGEIRYCDAFDVARITEFRVMCHGEGITHGGVVPCEEGNNAT